MSTAADQATVFVARQPIFRPDAEPYAYELLFRSGQENRADVLDPNVSTLDVISGALFEVGLDELTGSRPAFVNFPRDLLVERVPDLLPPDKVVVEILENVAPEWQVLAACKQLKAAGYRIALDDFILEHEGSPFLDLADIVKVDFLGTTPEERRRIGEDLARRGTEALAEKVETHEEFEEAKDAGYAYFQGYFFAKPVVHEGRTIPANKLVQLQVLEKLAQPEIAYGELETVIKQDVALTYRLLRYINSVWFGLKHEVESIHHALVWLGPREIKKWAALVSLRNLAEGKPSELLLRSMTRARMAEGLAEPAGMKPQAPELFLMGMFSLIDALLDMPLKDALEKLPVSDGIREALLGGANPHGLIHRSIIAYEQADWDTFLHSAGSARLDERLYPPLFAESVKWANGALACALE
jgi:EAL and modified HD-GYP domain-containing signal transduction protein